MSSEFELIDRYFTRPTKNATLGVGDDCALLDFKQATQLAISTDMLVAGRHFFADVNPYSLGHKALAVNLSDLAAMGAKPIAFTLALALPKADETWLNQFSQGLFVLADVYDCELIGGDTTATDGPLTISISIFGETKKALRRDHAQVGDDIWVSHTLGDARLALAVLRKEIELSENDQGKIMPRLHIPQARIELGLALNTIAHAAIDVSDGLSGDLAHILKASHCGATICVDDIPVSDVLKKQPLATRYTFSLTGGDDYELCFTAAKKQRLAINQLAKKLQLPLTRIGRIEQNLGLRIVDRQCKEMVLNESSFDHFKK